MITHLLKQNKSKNFKIMDKKINYLKTEITFVQVAHLYLRSELKLSITDGSEYKTDFRSTDNLRWMDALPKEDGVSYKPIFTPFENLIKPAKANKFVAELLGINEGDEYVMETELIKLYKSNDDCVITTDLFSLGIRHSFIQTLLIAAGYNIFNIKDCQYE